MEGCREVSTPYVVRGGYSMYVEDIATQWQSVYNSTAVELRCASITNFGKCLPQESKAPRNKAAVPSRREEACAREEAHSTTLLTIRAHCVLWIGPWASSCPRTLMIEVGGQHSRWTERAQPPAGQYQPPLPTPTADTGYSCLRIRNRTRYTPSVKVSRYKGKIVTGWE